MILTNALAEGFTHSQFTLHGNFPLEGKLSKVGFKRGRAPILRLCAKGAVSFDCRQTAESNLAADSNNEDYHFH